MLTVQTKKRYEKWTNEEIAKIPAYSDTELIEKYYEIEQKIKILHGQLNAERSETILEKQTKGYSFGSTEIAVLQMRIMCLNKIRTQLLIEIQRRGIKLPI